MQGQMIQLQMACLSSSGSTTRTLSVTMFLFLMISSGAQLGWSGPCRLLGYLLFWHRSRAMSVWMMYVIYVLDWRGECKPTMLSLSLSILHGMFVMITRFATYAFNAIMPLSRASTRGRYSRIEGVTTLSQYHPHMHEHCAQSVYEDNFEHSIDKSPGHSWAQRAWRHSRRLQKEL